MTFIPYAVNYANRQVDLELLQSIAKPVSLQQVTVSNVSQSPKIVTGVEKAIQRYALLFLTILGDVKFAPNLGTTFLQSIYTGSVRNTGYLQHIFALANSNVLSQLKFDDLNATAFGTIPDDERIIAGSLLDSNVDYATSTLQLTVQLTTAAGTNMTFIVPVTAAR